MSVKDLDILKTLLLTEEETETLPQGFEEDPMGFILKKYPGLNTVMEYMMTPDFKEYVDAIFIVAPKPTTFKILLHNGQFFFLQFMGKAYQATVQGKNYYLMSIGEKERCMLAIARLLRYGNPLKTKGPEGAEQGTRPEGEEGGGGETAPAETPETGGEEETPVTESMILENILKKSLAEAKQNLVKFIKSGLDAKNLAGGKSSKHGSHLRYQIGTEEETTKLLQDILNTIPGENFYEIEVIPADDFSKGAKSGTYNTHKITITKDNESFKKGEEVFVVNQKTSKITITPKSLTPTKLGLTGTIYKDHSSLKNDLVSKVKNIKDKSTSQLLVSLTNMVDDKIPSEFNEVSEIKDYQKTVNIDSNVEALMKGFSEQDLNIIGKDYGEELGALAMLKSVKNTDQGLQFPKGNNPLVDFYLDGYKISSKYKGGAAATLTQIVKNLDQKQLTSPEEQALFAILQNVAEKGVSEGYISAAIELKSPAIAKLANIIGVKPEEVTSQSIQDYIEKLKKKKTSDFNSLFIKTFDPVYKEMNRYPKDKKVNWEKIEPGKEYGAIIGPISYHVADLMNAQAKYASALSKILSKIDIKQLYMDIQLNKKILTFKLKAFSDPNAKFKFSVGSQSTYNPENSRLGFELQ